MLWFTDGGSINKDASLWLSYWRSWRPVPCWQSSFRVHNRLQAHFSLDLRLEAWHAVWLDPVREQRPATKPSKIKNKSAAFRNFQTHCGIQFSYCVMLCRHKNDIFELKSQESEDSKGKVDREESSWFLIWWFVICRLDFIGYRKTAEPSETSIDHLFVRQFSELTWWHVGQHSYELLTFWTRCSINKQP